LLAATNLQFPIVPFLLASALMFVCLSSNADVAFLSPFLLVKNFFSLRLALQLLFAARTVCLKMGDEFIIAEHVF
jgi:hypothetical protein